MAHSFEAPTVTFMALLVPAEKATRLQVVRALFFAYPQTASSAARSLFAYFRDEILAKPSPSEPMEICTESRTVDPPTALAPFSGLERIFPFQSLNPWQAFKELERTP